MDYHASNSYFVLALSLFLIHSAVLLYVSAVCAPFHLSFCLSATFYVALLVYWFLYLCCSHFVCVYVPSYVL